MQEDKNKIDGNNFSENDSVEFFDDKNEINDYNSKNRFWNIERVAAFILFLVYLVPNFLNRVSDSLNYSKLPPIYQRLHEYKMVDFFGILIANSVILLLIWLTDTFSEGGGIYRGMDVVKSPRIIVKILAWIIFLTPIVAYFYSNYVLKIQLNLWVPTFNIAEIQKSWMPVYDIIKPPAFFK